MLVIPVSVHFLPDVRPRGGGGGDGGAVVSVAEALPLQDVLGVLPLQVAGQHGGVGHAAEERVRSPQHPASPNHSLHAAQTRAAATAAAALTGNPDCAHFQAWG